MGRSLASALSAVYNTRATEPAAVTAEELSCGGGVRVGVQVKSTEEAPYGLERANQCGTRTALHQNHWVTAHWTGGCGCAVASVLSILNGGLENALKQMQRANQPDTGLAWAPLLVQTNSPVESHHIPGWNFGFRVDFPLREERIYISRLSHSNLKYDHFWT